ncbi:MAG: hypothetical protein HOH43_05805 [Candidatus Latescibacteria bacterium]|nr:hypothetical protein [Candidatus Latescibacterota bacterium]
MGKFRWVSLLGEHNLDGEEIVIRGGTTNTDRGENYNVGQIVSDQYFGGGNMSAKIRFEQSCEHSSAGFILYYHASTGGFVAATLGAGGSLCTIATWGGQQWTTHAARGPATHLQPDTEYQFDVTVRGSKVIASLDGVSILTTDLSFVIPKGQAGVWALGPDDVRFMDLAIEVEAPKIFVVMQFTAPYNELYNDVITPVCNGLGFDVVRADDVTGPGLIIADITRQISESAAVIADITPDNPNVFWEVGYAHALQKPTVLVAERERNLPFDVSPFRTLFYENTIAGKARIEDGLRQHIEAIQQQWQAV